MRKISLIGFVMLIVSIPTFAGGLLTNTNQHVAFLRMLARGASIDIDGVYSNPAGLAFLPGDGLYLSLNGQSAYQTRNIDMTFPLFPEDGHRRYYKGKASAPFIPSFQGAYKKGDWTISGSFAVGGGGGKASFDDGLGMFDSMVMGQIYQAASGKVTPNMYTINSAMDGSQFIYGVQLGLSYKVNDWLGVFAGGRMNYFSGGYEGFLTAKVKADLPGMPAGTELAGIELDCDQTGWGITPILGADVKLGKWNIGLKYEFMTSLNLENKTKKAEVRQMGNVIDKRNTTMEKVEFTQGILAMESDLHRFAYKLTSDRDSANDLVQDCVLQALDNHEKFAHAKNLKGWMFTIMRNIFVNNYRRTVREMNIIDDTYSINQQSLIEDEDSDRFEFAYDMKQLYRVIHSIPEDMKVPFQMFVAGFKYREIAEKLGLPMGTVKSRLFFIRKRLKEELKDFS